MTDPQPREPQSLSQLADQSPRQPRRRRAAGVAFSVAAHAGLLAMILFMHRDQPAEAPDGPEMMASLVDGFQQSPAPAAPAAEAKPQVKQAVQPPKPKTLVRKAKLAADDDRLEADDDPAPVLSAAQLASATPAESGGGGAGGQGEGSAGGGGRRCNMASLVQAALRKDHLVQSAVATTGGQAMLVWNGDWVRSGGQDGKGLAAVREAILWEVGFAPAACRTEPMHGLVLLSLKEGPGSPRLVVGSDQWRWSDLLNPKIR